MLSDAKAWNAKGKSKPYKLADSAQLYLLVRPTGSKSWCYNYFLDDRQKTLILGHYPALSILDARVKRDELKAVLKEGREPRIVKKLLIEENVAAARTTFEKVARTWHAHTKSRWSSIHADDVIRSLERDVFIEIGNLPISDITPQLVLEVLRAVENRGAIETAHRLRQRISASFVYAIAHGWATSDPAAKVGAALSAVKRGRQPAITDLARLQKMIRDAEADYARPITRYALRFIALTAVRPNELHGGAWREHERLDSPEPLWRIPAWRMQRDRERIKRSDHLVPLARQSVDVLRAIWPLTGGGHYIFPSARNVHRPMSADAIGSLLRRAGYHGCHVSHLFRGAFSTIMNAWAEHRGKEHDRDVIDLMLSYTRERTVAGTCNRAAYMLRRRELAQIWADMLCEHLPEPELLMDRPSRGVIGVADDLPR
ncbi:integrase arm-type DNA-binding domain-containing protein [Novosphingobium sp. G106]|uniref:tyrosine-type recombinase/integrase n=1 Tax=Novosphingobium sp. G106 TaxID=2849500 RepID=UPI001C2DC539|nr:integrase arm-type DNA-binding domain-containing protein [Novosphingobium sp. G106]MBV1689308.1 integrase arm-type DNA-binding domain-containing protein [Novosphingobium sp. G106]